MGDPVSGAILGAVASELLLLVKDAIKKSYNCKENCKRLEKALVNIMLLLNDVMNTGSEHIPQYRQNQLLELCNRLKDGTDLVKKCSKVNRYNWYKSNKFSTKIEALEKYIVDFGSNRGWLLTMCEVRDFREDMKKGLERIQRESATREPQPAIIDSMSQLQTNEEIPIRSPQIPEMPKSPVGLQISIDGLCERLFPNDVSYVAVKGFGGSGKTTLATALCADRKITDHFNDRIVFETISQSPNLMVTIERLWDKLVLPKRPDFQNDEDAHMQLQQRLSQMSSQPTLVVLDDVWKKIHLEKLLFEAEGYKTVITTRNSLVEAKCEYDLQLLREEDALSLFRFWAFGHQTVPGVNQNLVTQVVKECKGLPLALKVIGSSLHDKPSAVWKDAIKRLSQAVPISDYHKDGLLSRLETSIDILEGNVRDLLFRFGDISRRQKKSCGCIVRPVGSCS